MSEVYKVNIKCRTILQYPKTKDTFRFFVPEKFANWAMPYPDYKPVEFTHPSVSGKVWADVDITPENKHQFKWHTLDGSINRISHDGEYPLFDNGRPKNPIGRTGMTSRGLLGRWGPNHAADPIVTRWLVKDNKPVLHEISQKPILEFIAIKRKVGGSWAFPGGMVDSGEQAEETAKREFCEEALNSLHWKSDKEKVDGLNIVENVFEKAKIVYKGYMDDPRNTDNAWMETVALHAHDPTGETVSKLKLTAGDDAVDVKWTPLNDNITLFANHKSLIHIVALSLDAHWTSKK